MNSQQVKDTISTVEALNGSYLSFEHKDTEEVCHNGHKIQTLVFLNCFYPSSTQLYSTCENRCFLDSYRIIS